MGLVESIEKLGHSVTAEAAKDIREIEKHPAYLAGALVGLPPELLARIGRTAGPAVTKILHTGAGGRTGKGDGLAGSRGDLHRPLGLNPDTPSSSGPQSMQCSCGAEAEAFTFSSRLQLTGAQAINTDLGDFYTTAASSDLTGNDFFPFNFDVREAAFFISTNSNNTVTALVETNAVVNSLKLIERKFSAQEQYQIGVVETAPLYSIEGANGTPTVTAPAKGSAIFDVSPDQIYVPWTRHYDVNEPWQLVVRIPRAATFAGLVDLVLNLRGLRH